MGAPASFAIVREGKTTLFYDHVGAYGFVSEVFFGPDMAETFFRSGREVDWLQDDGWAEAGAVLDFDAKRFAFFAEDYSNTYHAEFRGYFLPVMQASWPGWNLHWALGEMVELADLLGRDPESVRGNLVEETNPGLGLPPELSLSSRYPATVVSILDGGQIRDLEFDDFASNLLAMGLAFHEATRAWSPAVHVSVSLDVPEGIILDHDSRRISAWDRSGNYLERCRDVLQARWPGWHYEVHHDGLPGQWMRTGRDPGRVSYGEAKILEQVLVHLAASCAIQPEVVLQHLAKLSDLGDRINPAEPIDSDDRAAILARSIAEYRRTRSTSSPTETTA